MSTSKFDCAITRPHLALHAGRDLEPALGLQVEAHLSDCADCRHELARSQEARERIAVFGRECADAAAGVDLLPALRLRIAAERPAESAAVQRTPARLYRLRWLAVPLAAAAAVLWSVDFGSEPLPGAVGVPTLSPGGLVSNNTNSSELQAQPASPSGALRRAGPQDERLRDSSMPLELQWRRAAHSVGAGSANALAGDTELR